MSSRLFGSSFPRSRRTTPFRRKSWGELFGGLLQEARLEKGRSVQQASEAAGMLATEWEAVEAGEVPRTWPQACRMADALGVDRMAMSSLVLFCEQAWD